MGGVVHVLAVTTYEVTVPVVVAVIATTGTVVATMIANRGRQAARSAEAQLTPNGGDSVADAVNRIEEHVVLSRESIVMLNRRVLRQEERLSEITGEVRKIGQTVTDMNKEIE
jgi:hypothetical protein